MKISQLATPALLVDAGALDHNLAEMAAALPGARLRPHVKAHKCTELARRQASCGHAGFACATIRERVRLVPGHVDPTMAYHQRLHLCAGDEVIDTWPIDLRGW